MKNFDKVRQRHNIRCGREKFYSELLQIHPRINPP